jgi:hypothetical protein
MTLIITISSAFVYMGYTLRSAEWRYSEWRVWNGTSLKVDDWSKPPYASELYDWRLCDSNCTMDMNYDQWEIINVVNASENQHVVSQLSEVLKQQFDR